ncbi:G-protein coupled receptor 15 [Lutra lutra]|uniref:G-protein coupled receptor 15 n=1 Tax=Lutra lutra TaxID=9657 RepID=UPI001FCFD5A6|nr:G-protein coupled receptor 15 [Lutra lutra]XP_047578709.1 G-protein coupled receptor 15 [Lutra lutra]XP_047578715.1 G-protein coupled receptor 15 [Lutra lutra]XP_047578719.1 G-protein coupled receptor 15 [Lutra lutra]XP_047578725.1 G-protein coupled receptor 15 [Lutra lutra]
MDPEATSVYLDYFYATSKNPDLEDTRSHVSYMSIFLPVFYTAVFLTGVLGNLILISALHFKQGSRRLIDIFIINLAVSDFIFLVTLPLWVDKEASLGLWRTGSFLCKGSSYMISVNMHCSVFLLTCMSVDRYLAIMCPAISRKFRRRDCAYGVCASVWFISCLLGLPTLLSRELTLIDDKPYCAEKRATSTKLTWALVALIFTFFVPLVSIVTCYCCITRKLCAHYQQAGKHSRKLRKSIKIIFIVVAAFVFSWLPFNTFKLLAIVSGLQQEVYFSSAFLQLGMEVSGPLAFANSCINPFIYYIFDSYIRRAIVHCLCPCVKNYDFGSSTETSDSHLTKVFSNFIHAEDFARRRKRSVSL